MSNYRENLKYIYSLTAIVLTLTLLIGITQVNAVATLPATDSHQMYVSGNSWSSVAPEPVPTILFSENFDAQADWYPVDGNESCNNIGACDGAPPSNWTYYRNTESWHPDEGEPTKEPSQRISATNAHGGSGKAWTRYHESSGTNTSTFGDDTLLIKSLEYEVQEIYAQFDIQFDPNWTWTDSDSVKFKMFRIYHFDGPDGVANPWDFFSDGDSGPIMILDIKRSPTYGMRWAWARRCDPQSAVYYCDGQSDADSDPVFQCPTGVTCTGPNGSPTHAEAFGTDWHTIKIRMKMNSALDVTDGIFELWFDGELHVSKTDINWKRAGSDVNIGWNAIGIGGNTTNWWDVPANKAEQWYALDNIVVSTEDIP